MPKKSKKKKRMKLTNKNILLLKTLSKRKDWLKSSVILNMKIKLAKKKSDKLKISEIKPKKKNGFKSIMKLKDNCMKES